jgi:hypothetical protein
LRHQPAFVGALLERDAFAVISLKSKKSIAPKGRSYKRQTTGLPRIVDFVTLTNAARAYAAVQTPSRIRPYHRALVRNPVIA